MVLCVNETVSVSDDRVLVIVVRNPTKDAEWALQIIHSDDYAGDFVSKLIDEVSYGNCMDCLKKPSSYKPIRSAALPRLFFEVK